MTIKRSASVQAVQEVECSQCGAQVGEPCRSHPHRKVTTSHEPRMTDYINKIGSEEYTLRHLKEKS